MMNIDVYVQSLSAADFATLIAVVRKRIKGRKRPLDCSRNVVPQCMGSAAMGRCTCQGALDAMMREREGRR